MNIIERNFYRLLRAGAFDTQEEIEALSAWKWNRLYQLAEMHDVTPILYKGLVRCQDQFFVQVPEKLLQQWKLLKKKWLRHPSQKNQLLKLLKKEQQ